MKRSLLPVLLLFSLQLGCAAQLGPARLIAQFTGQGLELRIYRVDSACPMLPGSEATVDGIKMTQWSEGRLVTGPHGLPICDEPLWVLSNFTSGATTTFQIRAPGTNVEAKFGQMFATRSATLVHPSDGHVQAGQRLTFNWSPATDTFPLDLAQGNMVLSDVGADGTDQYLLASLNHATRWDAEGSITVEGGQLHATIPAWMASPPLPAGHLALDADFSAQVLECNGVGHCSTLQHARIDLPNTSVP